MLYLKFYFNPNWVESKPFTYDHDYNFKSFVDKNQLWDFAHAIIKREQKIKVPHYSHIEGYEGKKKLWTMEVISDEVR